MLSRRSISRALADPNDVLVSALSDAAGGIGKHRNSGRDAACVAGAQDGADEVQHLGTPCCSAMWRRDRQAMPPGRKAGSGRRGRSGRSAVPAGRARCATTPRNGGSAWVGGPSLGAPRASGHDGSLQSLQAISLSSCRLAQALLSGTGIDFALLTQRWRALQIRHRQPIQNRRPRQSSARSHPFRTPPPISLRSPHWVGRTELFGSLEKSFGVIRPDFRNANAQPRSAR